MSCGWIENELENVTGYAKTMMQAQVDRFKSSVHLLQDYYYAIENRLIADAPEKYTIDIMEEGEEAEELPAVFHKDEENPDAEETYPLLEKLYENAIKAQVVPDPDEAAAAGGKDAKKGKDPKKGAVEEEEETQYFFEEELKTAIKLEQELLRFRLTMIRNWTLNRLQEIRTNSN